MKNIEIEMAIKAMRNPESIFMKGCFDYSTRQELRMMRNRLENIYGTFCELRTEVFKSFVDSGKASEENGIIKVKQEHTEEISKDLIELGNVDTRIDFISDKTADLLLDCNMTMADEEVVLMIAGRAPGDKTEDIA